jgi:iron(II)-dependent oxidoreductase
VTVALLAGTSACRGCDARVAAVPHADDDVGPARAEAKRLHEPAPAPFPDALACETTSTNQCFVLIPAGRSRQGAQATDPGAPGYDPDARPDEAPVHEVELPAFRLMQAEANRWSFRECVGAGWCDPADVEDYASFSGVEGSPTHAVSGLSWTGAARLCAWMGARLPTEAEWERAARGDDLRRFPWGDEPGCGRFVYTADGKAPEGPISCAFDGVVESGNLRGESPFGVQGMGGNVWEWVADAYDPEAYAHRDPVDPRGPATGERRVQRGGGWTSADPLELRAAARGALDPDQKLPDVGVRCARDAGAAE